jgi:hypothetical protein
MEGLMIHTDALFMPDSAVNYKTVFLTKLIMAIQLTADENGVTKLGPLSQLGSGSTLEICGTGFNERTIKVRMAGQCYFVFLQDIESN